VRRYTGVGESTYAAAIITRPHAAARVAVPAPAGAALAPRHVSVEALPQPLRHKFEARAHHVRDLRQKTSELLRKEGAPPPGTGEVEEPLAGARPAPPETSPLAPTHVLPPLAEAEEAVEEPRRGVEGAEGGAAGAGTREERLAPGAAAAPVSPGRLAEAEAVAPTTPARATPVLRPRVVVQALPRGALVAETSTKAAPAIEPKVRGSARVTAGSGARCSASQGDCTPGAVSW